MKNAKHIVEINWNFGSTTYNKVPRKLKKRLKASIIGHGNWKTKECIINHFTRNFRGQLGTHKVTSWSLG